MNCQSSRADMKSDQRAVAADGKKIIWMWWVQLLSWIIRPAAAGRSVMQMKVFSLCPPLRPSSISLLYRRGEVQDLLEAVIPDMKALDAQQ